jgi:hypothetical protein
LLVRASGLGYAPVAGPVAYAEAWLTLGEETYLVRLQNFRRNDAKRVVSRRASRLGAAGEAAFWDTLWADNPRADEALRLLERAVRRDPKDGRSQFLLGMLRLYRAATACADFDFAHLCDAAKAEARPRSCRSTGPSRSSQRYADRGLRRRRHLRQRLRAERRGPARARPAPDRGAVDTNALFNSFDLFARRRAGHAR